MGYHLRTIKKQKIGTIEKILEEVEEYQDAIEQKCEIMAVLELADIYGALQLVAEKHGKTMEDLKIMATITRRAFEDGSRSLESLSSVFKHQKAEFNREMREPWEVQPLSDVKDYDTDEDIRNAEIEEVFIELIANYQDLRIDTHQNRIHVTVVHIPTGLFAASCLDTNFIENKHIAIRSLAELIFNDRNTKAIEKIKQRFKEPLKSPGVPLYT